MGGDFGFPHHNPGAWHSSTYGVLALLQVDLPAQLKAPVHRHVTMLEVCFVCMYVHVCVQCAVHVQVKCSPAIGWIDQIFHVDTKVKD